MVAMSSPLQRAAQRPFCVCQLLHFCQLLSNPSIDLEFEYIFGKPMKCRFQRCIVHMEILTFHARVEYISVTKYAIETIGLMGQTTPKSTLPLEARGSHLIYERQTTARSVHALPHNYATKAYWLQWDAQNSPQNCPFPFDDNQPHLIHPSLNRPHSPSPTASGSNQPFCHSTLCRLTKRPMD